ncbi:C40 family peptidase [Lactiplantibacillus plajomi]|uniref:C40 family peptidase n=1 Tax=Lactiplantibacillus plajomi TaxID=1457217 RepID=A0ABV6K1U3_9LACO|nr:NlpC/P60 family protein [Lactiplantibacillus plajomi]
MKQRLIASLIAALGLGVAMWQAPAVSASTNRVVSSTNQSKTGYLRKKSSTALYKMSGAKNNTKIKKVSKLGNYSNTTWFVTKKRSVKTNGATKKYYYVKKSNQNVKGWVRTNGVKKSTKSYTNLYKVAKSKLGHRYVYGATGPNVFDCSGFTKYIFKSASKKSLPRTAQAQYNAYKKVSKRNVKKGDLVFFGNSKRSISHVGIYAGGGKMIDAQNSGVKKEKIYVPWWHAVGYCRPVNLGA